MLCPPTLRIAIFLHATHLSEWDGSGHGGFKNRGFHLSPTAAWPSQRKTGHAAAASQHQATNPRQERQGGFLQLKKWRLCPQEIQENLRN